MADKVKTELFAETLIPQHTQRVPENARHVFTSTAKSMVESGKAQLREFSNKLKTGLYVGGAREYLAAELRDEARAMFDISETAVTTGIRESLEQFRALAATVPPIDYHAAREIRDVLRGMTKEDRERAVTLSADPQVAAAVIHAPGGGIGLGVSDNAKRQVLVNFNKAHRAELMQRMADAEATIAAIEEFRRTVAAELRDALK